jgi:hypothetical protein
MTATIDCRPRRTVDGREFIQYDSYWIRFYEPPTDTYKARLSLIDALTRRTFHHCEPGINTPGYRLELARSRYENQANPDEKRVNAAMLAGALFNRATDIFRVVVELESKGIKISRQNELLKQCGQCFREALELGSFVRHISGQEGVDELWGEPFKVFTMPLKDYYESRYIKISQTMRNIDDISHRMIDVFMDIEGFEGILTRIAEFADIAKRLTEIMKSDPDFFQIWPQYEVCRDKLLAYLPNPNEYGDDEFDDPLFLRACKLLEGGCNLIYHVAGVRVPMEKSAVAYFGHLDNFITLMSQPRKRIAT